jgi:hypothetical protein
LDWWFDRHWGYDCGINYLAFEEFIHRCSGSLGVIGHHNSAKSVAQRFYPYQLGSDDLDDACDSSHVLLPNLALTEGVTKNYQT